MREWEKIIPEVDRALYEKKGFGTRKQAFGVRPALLISDVTRGFIGSKPMPLLEAVEEYSGSCGEAGWVALAHIEKLLEKCRNGSIPVIFTTGDPALRKIIGGAGIGNH